MHASLGLRQAIAAIRRVWPALIVAPVLVAAPVPFTPALVAQTPQTVPAGGQPLPAPTTRAFHQAFENQLNAKAKAVTGKKDAAGNLLDPNGNVISSTVVNGLILTRDTFVSDLDAYVRELDRVQALPLDEKQALVRQWMDSFGRAATDNGVSKLTEEYGKFVRAAANAKDLHGAQQQNHQALIKNAEQVEKLDRENPGTTHALNGQTARQWRESAANTPYGYFLAQRERFYGLLQQQSLLAMRKGGVYLFQAFNQLPYGAKLSDYMETFNTFIDAARDEARQQRADAAKATTIDELWKFGGPRFTAQHLKAAAIGKALGATLPQLHVSELQAVFEGYRITKEEQDEFYNTLADLGLNILAAGSILIPGGPIIAAGVAAIQIARDGNELRITYLDEEQARQTASVTGYTYVITAEDRAAAAGGKLFLTVVTSAADVIGGLAEIKNISFLKGGGKLAGAADDAARAANAVAREIDQARTVATKYGLTRAIDEARTTLTDASRTAERALGAHSTVNRLNRLEDVIQGARAAGVSDATIDAAIAKARTASGAQGGLEALERELTIAKLNADGVTVAVPKADDDLATYGLLVTGDKPEGEFALKRFRARPGPLRTVNLDADMAIEIRKKMDAAARGQRVTFTEAEKALVRNEIIPRGDGALKLYYFDEDLADLLPLFDRKFLDDLATVRGQRPRDLTPGATTNAATTGGTAGASGAAAPPTSAAPTPNPGRSDASKAATEIGAVGRAITDATANTGTTSATPAKPNPPRRSTGSTMAVGTTAQQAAYREFSREFGRAVPTTVTTQADGSVVVESTDGSKKVVARPGKDEDGDDVYETETYGPPVETTGLSEDAASDLDRIEREIRDGIVDELRADPDDWTKTIDKEKGTVTYTSPDGTRGFVGRLRNGEVSVRRVAPSTTTPATKAAETPAAPARAEGTGSGTSMVSPSNIVDLVKLLRYSTDSPSPLSLSRFRSEPPPLISVEDFITGGRRPDKGIQLMFLTFDGELDKTEDVMEARTDDGHTGFGARVWSAVVQWLGPRDRASVNQAAASHTFAPRPRWSHTSAPARVVAVSQSSSSDTIGRVRVFFSSLGGSTGKVFQVRVLNEVRRSLSFTGDGVLVEPLEKAAYAALERQVQQEIAKLGPSASTVLRPSAYCAEFLKLPPPAGTAYRVARAEDQERLDPLRRVLVASRRLQRAGRLKPDMNASEYYHAITQWALWTKAQGFTESTYAKAFVEQTKKALLDAKRPWSKEIEQLLTRAVPHRWTEISNILAEAETEPRRE